MSNELEKPTPRALDGFDVYDDAVEGQEEPRSQQGSLVKFTNEATWVANGEEISPELKLVAVDVDRYVVYWKPDGSGPDRERSYYLGPSDKFPDIKLLNATAPESEWREAFGSMHGPWQAQHIVRLLNPDSLDRYSYPTSTDGGHIAVKDLVDRTRWMRKVKNDPNIYAQVTLSNTFMSTRFGGRQRPHFHIVQFVKLGGGELVAADTPSIAGPASEGSGPAPATGTSGVAAASMQAVAPPSLKEEINDAIPF